MQNNLKIERLIILIGFKHTGKSLLGKLLADALQLNFIDLDKEIESAYNKASHAKYSCREIMEKHGELYFRTLEKETLVIVLANAQHAVIALGGGTVMHRSNQQLIEHCKPIVIHITAAPKIVFKRIMENGKPVFFTDTNEKKCFELLWKKRQKIYQKLADFSVENNDDSLTAVHHIIEKIASYAHHA